ncbi:ribose-5-phosphate isomerase RpiA [Pseudobacter ginsenosidimutans]|uniref:Ribose-5-phosphate isomerase A n=1 Tax=Pseudobacter ginsenosidimutans TaxID=661488 RepID=A0A4Q7MZQ0_9BACT|nr:ribose-5-phosphate isomerase RpiA [Pseudobacter ginsenosidimutans]QEC40573.1 ribose-5-phosphate isomerase RpiA [Pseudobacter ginsenosidimutans]RZS72713.1 ribose-5-phosphate isomerase [Pseudobacter ginsenosidimutans]
MLTNAAIKELVGTQAAELVQSGMTIGIGTGTTMEWMIRALGKKVNSGLEIRAVSTSQASNELAAQFNIPLIELNDAAKIQLAIDGADEIDPQLQLIKGGGGALFQEKMVAAAAEEFVVIADDTKLVDQLGAYPLPVEVMIFNWKQVDKQLAKLIGKPQQLRLKKDGSPFMTDHGNYIIDISFGVIENPDALNQALHDIPGVIETGLFLGMAGKALIGYPDGQTEWIERAG